jgi:hypothetical protein
MVDSLKHGFYDEISNDIFSKKWNEDCTMVMLKCDKEYPTCNECYTDMRAGQLNFVKQCTSLNKECCNYKVPKPKKDPEYREWIYFTIAPSKYRTGGLNMDDLVPLKNWCDLWFKDYNYKQFFYAIESGKDSKEPFLHVHALVKGLNKKLKKCGHYKVLKNEWNRDLRCKCEHIYSFMEKSANNKLDADILYQHINSKELWEKKYNYLNNDLKGTHRNFTNLAGGGTPG